MPESVAKYWPILAALFVGAGGASSLIVTRSEATALAELAAANATLEATREALGSCMATVGALTGQPPPKERP